MSNTNLVVVNTKSKGGLFQGRDIDHHNGETNNHYDSFMKILILVLMCYVSVVSGIIMIYKSSSDVKSPNYDNSEQLKLSSLNRISENDHVEESYHYASLSGKRDLAPPLTPFTVKSMDYDSVFWKDCSYNLNFSETTKRYSNEFSNYFNDGMMAPVIGKVECQEIRFFESHSYFKTSFFGMFYSKVVSSIETNDINLFTQDSHLFYPITSSYQVVTVDGGSQNYIDICGNASALVSRLTMGGKNPLLTLYPNFNFTTCGEMFCNVNATRYDPFNLYFRALNYSNVYKNSGTRDSFYRDLHILSIITNRCQYCKSEAPFRERVKNQECPFMVNYPARSAERACMGKNGFSVFYPYMSLDQYLQTTGNPFLCYCYESSIYASRCDSIHTTIYPIYDVIMNPYLEVAIEVTLFIFITFILVLPLLRDIYKRGRYFFKDFDMILRALSVIPFWIFRLVYCFLSMSLNEVYVLEYEKSGRFVNELIYIALDTIGFDYVFIPLVIKWNQTYHKIKLYANENSDISRKRTYLSSVIMMIVLYVITIGCGMVIIICSIVLKYHHRIFNEGGSTSDSLIIMILSLIGTPIIVTLVAFFVLSALIQRKLKEASDVSFVTTNYVATSRTYTLVSFAQFVPTLISALSLYFGYDSILATIYYFSSSIMQVTTDALEIYVIFLLADKQSLKEFYYDLIWTRISLMFAKCWKTKITSNDSMTSHSSAPPSAQSLAESTTESSDSYYTKME